MPRIRFPARIAPFALTALALAACGMAGAATIQSGAPALAAPSMPACALVITERGDRITVEGGIEGRAATAGSYALRAIHRNAGGSAQVSQGGDFVLRAGERQSLGRAEFTGAAADLAAGLTIETGGATVACPVTERF